MKTLSEIRKSFWYNFPQFQMYYRVKKRQNDYGNIIRSHFVDFIDYLQKNDIISEKLANRATL